MVIHGIYIIKNTINNKVYVGSGAGKNGIKDRFYKHRSSLKHNKHYNKHLQAAYNVYGSKAFSYEILEKCAPELCLQREQHYLDLYKSYNSNFGYNLCEKAGNSLNRKHSKETKLKISQNRVYGPSAMKGQTMSWESTKKMSKAQKESTKSRAHIDHLNKSKRKPVVGVNVLTGDIIKLSHAGEDSRFAKGGICMSCKGKIPHYKGFKWSYQ